MFDSQICSLASITFLVQLLGLAVAIAFRVSPRDRLTSYLGLACGLLLMTVSTFACLLVDRTSGLAQGVALVAVAVLISWRAPAPESAGF